ncbi:phospholipase-like protein [Tanacetum coccineum]
MMNRAKDIENMTIAEYIEYEADLKRQSRRSTRSSHLKRYEGMELNSSHRGKNIALEYPHYSNNAKIDAYYDLPPLLPCFQPIHPHTHYGHNPPCTDVESVRGAYESEMDKKGQDTCAKETISEWFKMEIEKYKRIQQKKDRECTKIRRRVQADCLKNWEAQIDVLTKKFQEEGTKEELNPGSFALPCTIGSLNFYAMADFGASVNVIPKSIFEILKLDYLKKTNMLVEMADMTKKVPIGIVETVLVKIDKLLFPSDFVVIDMLEARNETMILGRPFLETIHAKINIFNKEISLGIREDRIAFNMNKKNHNFTTPVKKVHVINSIQDGEPSNSSIIINQNNNTLENDDMQERWGKKARIDEANPTIPKLHICRPEIYGIDEKGKLREWYCYHDDKKRGMAGEGLSFPDFLFVKYKGNQGSDLIWDKRYAEWCDKNLILCPSTSKLNTTQLDYKPKPKEYTFKEWMLIKVGHTNVNELVKRALLKSWVIDCFEAELGPTKDPLARSFDDYKWVFDLEIDQLADEYEIRIGKKGHILEEIWENCKKVQGDDTYWCFIYVTKETKDTLSLGRENGSRFREIILKELFTDKKARGVTDRILEDYWRKVFNKVELENEKKEDSEEYGERVN